jgi:phosphoribosylanthranilate isomerase
MNIKVCGITTFKQLQQLDGLEVDMAGIVLIPDSPWFAGNTLDAKEVCKADFDLKKVGILYNPSLSEALDWIDAYKLDVVQLNGSEDPILCEDLSTEVEVIKSFQIGDSVPELEKELADYDAVCDYYLFTGNGQTTAGVYGNAFNWSLLEALRIEKPFFLSGEIQERQAAALRKFSHPDFFGADLAQSFEVAPGEKDLKSILQFRQQVR